MISDDIAKSLHDKATRGLPLSVEEQSQLENWYAIQDSIENTKLAQKSDVSNIVSLQKQIDAGLSKLMTITRRIQEVTLENQALRREIAILRDNLVHVPLEKIA